MSRRRGAGADGLVVVGDALLDRDVAGTVTRICPDAPVPVFDESASTSRPGGAALAAALAAGDGADVTLVTSLGDDPAGDELRSLLADAGVRVLAGMSASATAEKVRFVASGRPVVRVDRGGPAGGSGEPSPRALEAISHAAVVIVSDYGRGQAAHPAVRRALSERVRPTVWDPHPRGPEPVAGTTVVTPNRSELERLSPTGLATDADRVGPTGAADRSPHGQSTGHGGFTLGAAARHLLRRWRVKAVAVTLGADGALLVQGDGPPLVAPAEPAEGDTCGAGDRFAAAVATGLLGGDVLADAVIAAVGVAGRYVAAGGAGSWRAGNGPQVDLRAAGPSPTGAFELVQQARRDGRRVVVAGGCFDILHAGHAALLQSARRLGDHLVVALNSDASVTRLKGPGRPVVPQADRAAMLLALECVDAVAVFEEDSPVELLRALRPHLFVKGGDYSGRQLPEQAVMAEWGGEVVVVPYLSGRSTTRLLERSGTLR